MKNHPIDYKDPAYDDIEARVSAKLGLPEGLLGAIRTKGERSNADQVSKAGARTVYQVVPATRRAAIAKYGIDPYLSAENAAEVAGRLLKDSLQRNDGSVTEAVAEYHAGTDRSARGPVNRAYVARVAGQAPENTAFERAKAAQAQTKGPSIAAVYEAYKTGKMTPQEAAEFEADVNAGTVMLPRGAALKASAKRPEVAVLPAGVVQAYNNLSEMTDAERAQVDQDVASGAVKLLKGTILKRPAPRTGAQAFGMGVRDIAMGGAGLLDIPTNALNATINLPFVAAGQKAPLGLDPFKNLMGAATDAAGLQAPATSQEKLISALNQGVVQALATAGLSVPFAGARGATGAVAKALSEAPVIDSLSSAAASTTSEQARQSGAGEGTQMLLGLAAGGATALGAVGARNVAAKFGPKAAKVVETVPEEVAFDAKGQVTEEGRHYAERAEIEPQQLKAAYAEAKTAEAEAAKSADVATMERPAAVPPEEVARLREAGVDVAEDGTIRPPSESPHVSPEPRPAPEVTAEPPMSESAAARLRDAQSEGISLSKAQATKDFAAQDAEQTLKAQASGEGEKARAFFAAQQEQIAGAVERFKASFGDPTLTAADRGAIVKDALRELRDQGKAGVTALYKSAREMATQLGDNAKGLLDLDTAPLLAKMRELWIDEAIPDQVRSALRQKAAQYGLIGRNPKTVEGITTVELLDETGKVAERIKFPGPVKRLSIDNAEDLRQTVNDLYMADTSKRSQALKGEIDQAVEAAVERAASEGMGDVGKAFGEARKGFKQQQATFKAKDIVQRLIDWKKGTGTDVLDKDRAIVEIMGSDENAISNLKKVKAILLSKPTETSKAAWRAIQAQAVANIFKKALSPDGSISGARLNSAIKAFGADKLKVMLDPADFNQLMKLKRIIGDATIPPAGATNPSGSAYKIMNMLGKSAMSLSGAARLVPGVGPTIDAAAAMVKGVRETVQAKETLEGVTSFTPEAAAAADTPKAKADPVAAMRGFIDLAASNRILAPLLASASASQNQEGSR